MVERGYAMKRYTKKDVEKMITGRQKGFLTYDEVNELLPEDISSSEDIDQIFEILGDEDIQLVENRFAKDLEKPLESVKSEIIPEQAIEDRFMPLDDPVKMYLKQMGSIPLLSRDEEIALAKKIEEAEENFKRAALVSRIVRNYIISVAEDIVAGKLNPEEYVKEDLKIHKVNVQTRIKRIIARLKTTRSEKNSAALILQFNFVTSVIEVAVRKLTNLVRELDHIDQQF